MQTRRIALAASIAALGFGLTACGGDDDSQASTTESSGAAAPSDSAPPPSSEASAGDSAGDAADGGSSDEVTAPGTELQVGDTATVPYTYGTDQEGTVAITVTAIEQGESADLAEFGDRANGLVPYFVKFTVENVEGTDLSYSSVSLGAVTADGRGTGVVISGDVEGKCESESADGDFTSAGATYESCTLQAAQEGVEIAGAEFDEGDDYMDEPVVWTN
ncbi:hypothetical protein [Saccharomonospora piscinae]|nr:hypothetical protein [Saccharomonospora piscinae]